MGRPFKKELGFISNTISYAETVDISTIERYLKYHRKERFIIVGSGGSFSVAQVFALALNYCGSFALACTPLEIINYANSAENTNVILYSAGGGNPDIIYAYKLCKKLEFHSVFVICLTQNSKLIRYAKEKNDISFFECKNLFGKDGFLAVNSTVLVVSLIKRLLGDNSKICNVELPRGIDSCLKRNSVVALGGRWSMPVVCDFESKCTEAGLIHVMPSDIRNFAHGRHHWLAKNTDTSVICIISPDEYDLAKRTLDVLPEHIDKCIVLSSNIGIGATEELLICAFQIISRLGELKGIDPGKPGVPPFGSSLYRLNYNLVKDAERLDYVCSSIIPRMSKRKLSVIGSMKNRKTVVDSANRFIDNLSKVFFKALVIDYDNTIISDNNTKCRCFELCLGYLNSFAKAGIGVCFATGRGKSIRDQILHCFDPESYENTFISYYNGAITLPLTQSLETCDDTCDELSDVIDDVSNDSYLCDSVHITKRIRCITCECREAFEVNNVFKRINSIIKKRGLIGVSVVKSDHSVDIVTNDVTKKNSIDYMRNAYGSAVLCIGDSGDEFGNDFELLDSEYSISVDKVSMALDSCWNIASLGIKGPNATAEYLSALKWEGNGLHFLAHYLYGAGKCRKN